MNPAGSPPIERQHPGSAVADHEVFLSFNSDDLAVRFTDWLYREGWNRFLHDKDSGVE